MPFRVRLATDLPNFLLGKGIAMASAEITRVNFSATAAARSSSEGV